MLNSVVLEHAGVPPRTHSCKGLMQQTKMARSVAKIGGVNATSNNVVSKQASIHPHTRTCKGLMQPTKMASSVAKIGGEDASFSSNRPASWQRMLTEQSSRPVVLLLLSPVMLALLPPIVLALQLPAMLAPPPQKALTEGSEGGVLKARGLLSRSVMGWERNSGDSSSGLGTFLE